MKKQNDYARSLPAFDATPKTVIAAIAYSLALRLEEDDHERAQRLLITEWDILNRGEIVPQPVPANLRYLITKE